MSTTWNQILVQLRGTTALDLVGSPVSAVIKELLASKSVQSSYYLGRIIKFIDANYPQFELTPIQLEAIVLQNINSVNQLTTFTFIYSIMKKQYSNTTTWRAAFLKERNQGMFEKFNEWAISQSANEGIFKELLKVLVCALPHILKAQYIEPSQIQFQSFLLWLSYFEVKDREEHESVCKAVKLIKDAKIANTPDYEHKGHLILRKIIELLGYEERQGGSLFMLFDPLSIREKDIEYFCNVYQHLLQDLDQLYLCNVFKSLTHCGINREILFFIEMISHILQNSEQFYTLRYLYHQYILPILAYKFKTHRKLQKQVFNLVLFYVAGFLAHCKLDESAVSCLTDNLEGLEPQRQMDWGQLALLACKEDLQLKQNTRKRLASLNIGNLSETNMGKIIEKNNKVWKVTVRNGRKLKKYPEIDSVRFKGMINRCNDCYIISTVQALFITEYLPNLFLKLRSTLKKEKAPVVYQLYKIFQDLKEGSEKRTIASLKNKGPQTFQNSNNQEDVQEYLLQLFNVLEEELKSVPDGLAYFQRLFRIEYEGKFICESCGQTWKKQRSEHSFISSFRQNESFEFQTQGRIQGYLCRKCKKDNLIQQTTIINEPKLLILHINRFSHQGGVAKKNLGNKPIKRKMGNYQLAGFISHRGAKISAGHYIFYGCLGKGRWGIFDDARVGEFSVGEQEEFERQFRSENTPYILFYRLVKKSE